MAECGKSYHYMLPAAYYEQAHPSDRLTYGLIWEGLKERTSAHGIPHIDNARGVIKKTFWSLITLGTCCVLFYNTYILCRKFFAYDVNVNVVIVSSQGLTFPAITVCNMNPMKKSALGQSPELTELLGEGPTKKRRKRAIDPQPLEGSRYSERVQPREEFLKQEKVTQILADLPLEIKRSLGYSIEEFVLDCAYSGVSCYSNDFISFYNPMHGNCYTFNSGWNSSSRSYISFRTGRRYGLQITINIGQDEYIDATSNAAGARVVVHDRNKMPFPEDEGFIVSPGSLSSVGLRKLRITRKGHPYGNCTDIESTGKDIQQNVFEELYNATYSASACQKTCYQKNVIITCGCADPNYPMTGAAFDYADVSACDTSNIELDDCKYGVNQKYMTNSLQCNCPNPCVDEVFIPQVSSAIWPSDISEDTIIAKLKDKMPLLAASGDADRIRRNLLQMEIYYEEFNFEQIYEKPAYDGGTFASDMGGILGLYVGFSIMTIFEFIEFAIDWFLVTCRKLRGTNNISYHSKLQELQRPGLHVGTIPAEKMKARKGNIATRRAKQTVAPMHGEPNLPGSPPPSYSSSTPTERVFHARNPKDHYRRNFSQTPQGVEKISLELV